MGGPACVVIIDGNAVQGESARLSTTAEASCQLVDYLENDEDTNFDPADAQPIADFHKRAKSVIKRLNTELDEINRALAKKYGRATD
jgi:hypothetical protein